MSENPEKPTKETESAADASEGTQATTAKDDKPTTAAQKDAAPAEETQATTAAEDEPTTEAQEDAAPAEEKSAKAPEEPTTAKDKPLEKMTVKELRELAKDIPGITGVHAMKKEELMTEIKATKGIKDEPVKKVSGSNRELKLQIKSLKAERQAALEAKDKKKATIFRRRISRLKKKTRKVAA